MLDPKYLKDRSGQLPSYITLGTLAKGRGLPINVSQIASLLAENPTALLTDNEFRFVD